MDRDPDNRGFDLKPATAIGYSIVTNMGGDRQMTVQCFVGEDDDDEAINRRIDKVFRICDRQKARYDLDKQYKEFEEAGRHLRNFLNAIPIAEHNAKCQTAALTVELRAKEEARKEVYEEGYSAHLNGRRRGEFVPGGALKSRLATMDGEIQKVRERIAAIPADTQQHKDKVLIDVQRYQDDLHKRRLHINDLRGLAGLGPYEEFMAEETANPLEAKGA